MHNPPRELTANVRLTQGKGTARELRRRGLVPGVVYGRGGENVSLWLSPSELRSAMDPERRLNTLFQLRIRGEKSEVLEPVVIADWQIDKADNTLLHVDFKRIDPEREVSVNIPVEYVGRALGVVAGGRLKTFRRNIRIAAKPSDIPVKLTVDVSPLENGKHFRVKDASLPNAKILESPEQTLAWIDPTKAKVEVEETAPVAATPAQAATPAAAPGKTGAPASAPAKSDKQAGKKKG